MSKIDDTLHDINRLEFSVGAMDADLYGIYKEGRPFVDIEQFLEDDYYFGKIAKDLYPDNKPDLIDIFDPRNNYVEVILAGAIGWGKTFLACIGLAYMIGQLSAYTNPHRWLGASPTSPLVFINMSVNAKKAKEVIFTRLKVMVDSSPYFKERFPRNTRLIDSLEWNVKQEEVGTRTGQQIIFKPGTGESLSALGDDIYGGACDELNFFRIVEKSKRAFGKSFDPAQKLYDTVSRRTKSRFMSSGLPLGKLFLISSAQLPDDFIERRVDEATKDGSLGRTIKYIKKSQWEGKKDVFLSGIPVFSNKTFRVEVGSSRKTSRIIDEYDVKQETVIKKEDFTITGKVLNVPVELWQDFYRDVEGSVRDFGGEVTRAIYPFFPDAEVIYDAIDSELVHPWSRQDTTLQDGSRLIIGSLFEVDEETKKWKPKRHPKKARYWHIDIALSGDALGLAVVHIGGWKQVMIAPNVFEDLPIIEVDLMLRVVAPSNGEISFGNVRAVLLNLKNHGMYLRFGSLDLKTMSADFMQIMRTKGVPCDHLSVDKDITPYTITKNAFYDSRMMMYEYEPVLTEFSQLEKNSEVNKVDHPPQGSKDVADAVTGATFQAFNHELKLSADEIKARLPHMKRAKSKDQIRQRLQDAEEEMRDFVGGNITVKKKRG